MIVASVHHFLSYWSIPSWAVAVGTVFLGAATVRLGGKAQKEADAVAKQAKLSGDQLDLTRQQLEASQQPFVLPVTNDWEPLMKFPMERVIPQGMGDPWEPWMMLTNAGAGPAINVTGGLFWYGGIGDGWQLVQTSVPAGRDIPARLVMHTGYEVKWPEAIGYLCYLDLTGTEWQTRFRYRQNVGGQYSVEFIGYGKTTELGVPDLNYVLTQH